MKELSDARRILRLLPLLAVPILPAHAQSPQSAKRAGELFRTIASLDSALSDSCNRWELDKFATFFIDDVEFYHGRSDARQAEPDR
jgi:hypothetical protein